MKNTIVLLTALPLFSGCTEYNLNKGNGLLGPAGQGSIAGKVCAPSGGNYLVGALVYVELDMNNDGKVDRRIEDTSDAEGNYELENLPAGEHTVHVEKGSFSSEFIVDLQTETHLVAEEECKVDPPDIAVITGSYDHIGDIIRGLDIDFDSYNGESFGGNYINLLKDLDKLKEYDILFLNCGINEDWKTSESQIKSNLKAFVENGGSIYASDWAHSFVETSFPDHIDFHGDDHDHYAAQAGAEGSITANVIDQNMKDILDSDKAHIAFDLGSWIVMDDTKDDVESLIRGDAPVMDMMSGETNYLNDKPLAVRFKSGEGKVVFTSFHNAHQNTTIDMRAILEEIIFSL